MTFALILGLIAVALVYVMAKRAGVGFWAYWKSLFTRSR